LKHFALALLWLPTLFLACTPVALAEKEEAAIETLLEQQNRWIVDMDVGVLNSYLSYPTSKCASPTTIAVDYREKDEANQWSVEKKYEVFWYRSRTPIGLHRYTQVPFGQYPFGVIYVKPSRLISDHCDSLADAIVRVVVEVLLSRTQVRAIFVPRDSFNQMVSALSGVNFHPFTVIKPGQKPVFIDVQSYPSGLEAHLYHQSNGLQLD
jgi:hypothetical protein